MFTVKIHFQNDYRRFSIPISATFEQLKEQIAQIYKITEEFTVKYIDDEGDLISLTTNSELIEAVRFANNQVPPILRLAIFANSSSECTTQEQQKQIIISADKKEEPSLSCTDIDTNASKEYPVIDISQWEAPKKEVVQSIQELPAHQPQSVQELPAHHSHAEIKKTIAQETKDLSRETSKSVQNSSLSTVMETHKYSAAVMENYPTTENSLVCSELSKQIADVCRNLSKTTSELCETMSKMTTAESSTNIAAEINSMSNDTVKLCHKLSKETAEMLEKQARETEKHSALLKEQSEKLGELSRQTVESGMILSKDTTASGNAASNEIRNTIKEL